MDERDHKAMNDELKKEQPSIELQISDEQLDKIKSCEVLKINGMEFISRTKTTEMLIKFANEQLKEKEEEIKAWKKVVDDYKALNDDKRIQLAKSNEMNERLADALESSVNGLIWFQEEYPSSYSNNDMEHLTKCKDLLTEYQNSKK